MRNRIVGNEWNLIQPELRHVGVVSESAKWQPKNDLKIVDPSHIMKITAKKQCSKLTFLKRKDERKKSIESTNLKYLAEKTLIPRG